MREDNIKLDLIGIEWGGMHRIYLAKDGNQWPVLVNTKVKLRDS
jgi:hypothetical protein